ncbi:MAG: 30S ribosomal protein S15 [Candidatus Omnitrophota bacterium]
MVLAKEKKKNILETYKHHEKDTGSAAVQVALITERVNSLADHFKAHKKDFQSRRGLLRLVSQRRRLMDYLKRRSRAEYDSLLKKLNLRK